MGELSRLYFGRDDAEGDLAEGLLRAGFLRTAAFDAALSGRKRLIVGRKGSGKSAISMTLAAIPDASYTPSRVVPDYISRDALQQFELKGVTDEASKTLFWRYVLVVQVAKHLIAHAQAMHKKAVPGSVDDVRKFLADNREAADPRSYENFWKVIQRLQSLSFGAFGANAGVQFAAPSAGLQASGQLEFIERKVLTGLTDLACPADHPRILLLVDELEQVWSGDPQSNALVSGLLMAAKHVTATFPGVRCVVFLRTDIYEVLQLPERDKFRGEEMHLDWTPARLAEMALARASASVGRELAPGGLWGGLFPAEVSGRPAADYLTSLTLGRPRDFIQLANLCRDTAEKNGRESVTAADIAEAAVQFSGWKLRDLADEYTVSYPYLADLFVLFQKSGYLVPRRELENRLGTIRDTLQQRFPGHRADFTDDMVIRRLYEISLLGVRRGQGFVYSYQDPVQIDQDEREFCVHPCFRRALRCIEAVGGAAPARVREAGAPVRVALWGPPQSGKTTFLSALTIAVSRSPQNLQIYGTDDASTDFLTGGITRLTSDRQFPPATVARSNLSWAVRLEAQIPERRLFGRHATRTVTREFGIDLLDVPGESYADGDPSRASSPGGYDRSADPYLVGDLAACQGFILLFDSTRESQRGDSLAFFSGTLLRIARQFPDVARLPHYLAVCATKFDEPDIYTKAVRLGYISRTPYDRQQFPRVADDRAEDFVRQLSKSSTSGNSDIMLESITRYFMPERVRYFVTSSIGFRLDRATRLFDEADFQNVDPRADGGQRIRGPIYPINVVEPVLWIGESIAEASS